MWFLGWEWGERVRVAGEGQEEERRGSERKADRGASLHGWRACCLQPAAGGELRLGLPSWGLTPVPLRCQASLPSRCPESRQLSTPVLPCTPVPDPLLPVLSVPLPPTPSPSSQVGPQLRAARGAATCQGRTAHWLQLALHQQDMCFRSLDLRFMQILHSAHSQSQACPSTKMTGWLFCQEDLPWLLHPAEAPRRPCGSGLGRPGERGMLRLEKNTGCYRT